jgi:hypothetical protein
MDYWPYKQQSRYEAEWTTGHTSNRVYMKLNGLLAIQATEQPTQYIQSHNKLDFIEGLKFNQQNWFTMQSYGLKNFSQ